jgi:cardiolipin synthase
LLAIPCFLIFLEAASFREALGVFVAAGVTDGLDGAIARLTHTKTALGAMLDPLADKLLLVSSFIALGFMHEVPRWLTVIVLTRDVMLVLGYGFLFMFTQQMMEIRPTPSGKLGTFLQLASVATVLVRLGYPELGVGVLEPPLFAFTGAVTATAGLQYMYRGLLWLQRHDTTEGGARPAP